jgi:hypothetical protein
MHAKKDGWLRFLSIAGIVIFASLMTVNTVSGSCSTQCKYEYVYESPPTTAWWEKVSCSDRNCLWIHYHKVCHYYSVWEVCYEVCTCETTGATETRVISRTWIRNERETCATNVLGSRWFKKGITPGGS